MSKPLVIVESPTKAKTIGKFLGSKYIVRASYGHIRDLPNNAAEIPAEVKKTPWGRLGINVEDNFKPLYIIPDEKKRHVNELKKDLKEASELLLATDEDREGESISWHLLSVLNPKVPVKRLVFHEITQEAIDASIASPRDIDENLVKAQETRRIIDRLFGYSVSPVLWKKMAPRLSAGRVQSVALRLLVERERERVVFREASYADLKALFKKQKDEGQFDAELTHVKGKRVASGKDFEPTTGKLLEKADVVHLTQKTAEELKARISSEIAKVTSVEERPYTQKPQAPFTTSTLQQEASRKFGFAARRTMQVAQLLYENGLITYMRTDSTTLSEEALRGARNLITREYGADYLYPEPRIYKTKVKNAQEAHEAIRPAGSDFTPMSAVKEKFGPEAFKLYELIWKRTIACQMKDAEGTRIAVTVDCGEASFRASGKTIKFPGYLRAYVEGSDDPEADIADQEKILPPLTQGEALDIGNLDVLMHTTQPPARYTEGSLIKELERLGIGRPSTWATIVDVVLSRTYAFKRGTALVPTFLAMAVVRLMENYFTNLTDYEFTARLEDDLDAISRGEAENLSYLDHFYNGNGHPGLKNLVSQGEKTIDPREVCGLPLGHDDAGNVVEVRIGRYGPFISDGTNRAGVPETLAPDELTIYKAKEILIEAQKGPASLGDHPELKLPIYLKKGRFGPYLQLGDGPMDGDEKPKMASLLPGMTPETVTLDVAVQLLGLPRTIGKNPENNEDIVAMNGRYGPYIKCGTDTRSLPAEGPSILDITLPQAIEVLKLPKRRGRGTAPASIKSFGKKPDTDIEITLKAGRYGPYVTDGTTNASLPRGMDQETLTIEQAITLLEERAAKGPAKKRPARAKGPAKAKAPAKGKKSKKKAADEEENVTT